jgi:hypothetical protein
LEQCGDITGNIPNEKSHETGFSKKMNMVVFTAGGSYLNLIK